MRSSEEKSDYEPLIFNAEKTGAKPTVESKIIAKFGLNYYKPLEVDAQGSPTKLINYNETTQKTTDTLDVSSMTDPKTFAYVVMQDEQTKALNLRLTTKNHYSATSGANCLAAGDITFKNGTLASFDDRSGGYHLEYGANSNDQNSVLRALRDVGLPMEKYTPSYMSKETVNAFISASQPATTELATKPVESGPIKMNSTAVVSPPTASPASKDPQQDQGLPSLSSNSISLKH